MYLLKKNILSESFIIHQSIDDLLKIDNDTIKNHILNFKKKENPFNIEWEVNISRIFTHILEQYNSDYNSSIILNNIQGILLFKNELYNKKSYINENFLNDSPDLSLIYNANNIDLKINFSHLFQRKNNNFSIVLKQNQFVVFNSGLEHTVFTDKEDVVLLLVHYQLI